jgi:hypothetical protein
MRKWIAAAVLYALAAPAFSSEQATVSGDTGSHRAGQDLPLEVDAQLGLFIGARLKGTVYSTGTFGFALEGLYGNSLVGFDPFSNGSSTAYGLGVRGDWYLSSSARDALLLSPAVDVYHVSDTGNWYGPNVDLSWLHQFSSHVGLVLGLQGGVQIGSSGHDADGKSYSGQTAPDVGVYVGMRF